MVTSSFFKGSKAKGAKESKDDVNNNNNIEVFNGEKI
jgi:hypothetical protein